MGDQRICDTPHAEGVRERDGRLQAAELLQLHEPTCLSEAVEHVRGCHGLACVDVALARHDDGHARVRVSMINGCVAHTHAGHVRDGVSRAARQLSYANYEVLRHGCAANRIAF